MELDWTLIVVNLIVTLPAILATVFAYLIHRAIRTPSGAKIGTVVEHGHNASVVGANTAIAIHQGEPVGGDMHKLVPAPLEPNNG